MTEESIDYAFRDSEIIKADLNADKYWQPFSLSKLVPDMDPTIQNPYSARAKQNKRQRRIHQAPRTTPPQYTPSTTYMKTLDTIPASVFGNQTEQQPSPSLTELEPNSPPTNKITTTNLTHQDIVPTPTDPEFEQRIRQLCETMVTESSLQLRQEIKTTNDNTLRKLHETTENIKEDINNKIDTLSIDTKNQIQQHRLDLEEKIDATRQDTSEIKTTQSDLQTTQQSILKNQDDMKSLLESLTTGIKQLLPDKPLTNPNQHTPMEDVKASAKKKIDTTNTITQSQPNKLQKTNKENISTYLGWRTYLNFEDPTQTNTERAATPSVTPKSRSERAPLAATQQ